MRTAVRFSWQRMLALDRSIRAGEFPNARKLGDHLGVDPRTIHRDIEFLRDRMGVPLEYDPVQHGYFYRDANYVLPAIPMTEGELVALFLAERALRQYRGTPYAVELARIFRKLAEALPDQVTVDLEYLAETHSFRTTAVAEMAPGLFAALVRAIRQHRRLRITYWSASHDEETVREIDPYHLAAVDGDWYVIAGCLRHGDIRIFNPVRIRALEPTEVPFEPPAGFCVEDYLADAFGIFRGADGERHRVRLFFSGKAAKYVAERTWHRSQTTEPTSDGGLIVTLELSHLQEITRWALSWGSDCLVLEPDELRAAVAREVSGSAARYLYPTGQPCKPLAVLDARLDSRRSTRTRGDKRCR